MTMMASMTMPPTMMKMLTRIKTTKNYDNPKKTAENDKEEITRKTERRRERKVKKEGGQTPTVPEEVVLPLQPYRGILGMDGESLAVRGHHAPQDKVPLLARLHHINHDLCHMRRPTLDPGDGRLCDAEQFALHVYQMVGIGEGLGHTLVDRWCSIALLLVKQTNKQTHTCFHLMHQTARIGLNE